MCVNRDALSYEYGETTPLFLLDTQYTEDMLKEYIFTDVKSIDWLGDDGDLAYLLETYKLTDISELLRYVSGIEIIDNNHNNTIKN